tara:strand:- start:42 stop:410 length:369 start_codon:yes stop_codon:yes gene_type:complete
MINVEFTEKKNPNKFIVERESFKQAYFFLHDGVNIEIVNNGCSSLNILKDLNKAEVVHHLLIVSKAYAFAHETLDRLINEEASEAELNKQDKLIKLIRKVLKGLAKYEENYDAEVLDKYKNN